MAFLVAIKHTTAFSCEPFIRSMTIDQRTINRDIIEKTPIKETLLPACKEL